MNRQTCAVLSSIHLLALAISTYIAAIEIETILVTGCICSATGIAAGVAARRCGRRLLAAIAFATPVIAVTLFVLECFFLRLGPNRAALPFCIVFIVHQVIATLVILVQLNLLLSPTAALARQITIRTLMVSMVSFSLFFAIARQLLAQWQHNWLMALALGLSGLTLVGLSMALYAAIANRYAPRAAFSKNDECRMPE